MCDLVFNLSRHTYIRCFHREAKRTNSWHTSFSHRTSVSCEIWINRLLTLIISGKFLPGQISPRGALLVLHDHVFSVMNHSFPKESEKEMRAVFISMLLLSLLFQKCLIQMFLFGCLLVPQEIGSHLSECIFFFCLSCTLGMPMCSFVEFINMEMDRSIFLSLNTFGRWWCTLQWFLELRGKLIAYKIKYDPWQCSKCYSS